MSNKTPYFEQAAIDMLGYQVPGSLFTRLNDVDDLMKKVNPDGELRSTQVIASIVDQWQREQDVEGIG